MTPPILELGERVARLARSLTIRTTVIGAYAMAIHRHVRASADLDLASHVDVTLLAALKEAVEAEGLSASLARPDVDDELGGKLIVWAEVDEDGDPFEPVEVVNFLNLHRPRPNPAARAIQNAVSIAESPDLAYPRLDDLIALKLFAGSEQDDLDIVELLRQNPETDVDEIRTTAKSYGFDRIDSIIERAQRSR